MKFSRILAALSFGVLLTGAVKADPVVVASGGYGDPFTLTFEEPLTFTFVQSYTDSRFELRIAGLFSSPASGSSSATGNVLLGPENIAPYAFQVSGSQLILWYYAPSSESYNAGDTMTLSAGTLISDDVSWGTGFTGPTTVTLTSVDDGSALSTLGVDIGFAVPEPAPWMLLGAGVGMLFLLRRRLTAA